MSKCKYIFIYLFIALAEFSVSEGVLDFVLLPKVNPDPLTFCPKYLGIILPKNIFHLFQDPVYYLTTNLLHFICVLLCVSISQIFYI